MIDTFLTVFLAVVAGNAVTALAIYGLALDRRSLPNSWRSIKAGLLILPAVLGTAGALIYLGS